MTRPRSHQMDIYGAWLHLATTHRQWATLRRRIDTLEESPKGIGFTSCDNAGDGSIHLSVYLDAKLLEGNPAGTVEILAHEAAHAATMLLDELGEQYDGESEALAYLVGWIAAWLWVAIT